jgi:hypothetical protein
MCNTLSFTINGVEQLLCKHGATSSKLHTQIGQWKVEDDELFQAVAEINRLESKGDPNNPDYYDVMPKAPASKKLKTGDDDGEYGEGTKPKPSSSNSAKSSETREKYETRSAPVPVKTEQPATSSSEYTPLFVTEGGVGYLGLLDIHQYFSNMSTDDFIDGRTPFEFRSDDNTHASLYLPKETVPGGQVKWELLPVKGNKVTITKTEPPLPADWCPQGIDPEDPDWQEQNRSRKFYWEAKLPDDVMVGFKWMKHSTTDPHWEQYQFPTRRNVKTITEIPAKHAGQL